MRRRTKPSERLRQHGAGLAIWGSVRFLLFAQPLGVPMALAGVVALEVAERLDRWGL